MFSATAAQGVSGEEWQPLQKTRCLVDERFEMKLPFVNQTEPVMNVLRHGGQVTVAAPESVVLAVNAPLRAALQANAVCA